MRTRCLEVERKVQGARGPADNCCQHCRAGLCGCDGRWPNCDPRECEAFQIEERSSWEGSGATSTGLEWRQCFDPRLGDYCNRGHWPTRGHWHSELKHDRLVATLEAKLTYGPELRDNRNPCMSRRECKAVLTQAEWDALDITRLRMEHFVRLRATSHHFEYIMRPALETFTTRPAHETRWTLYRQRTDATDGS